MSSNMKNKLKSTPSAQRRDEIFRRVGANSLVTLILQSAQVQLEESLLLRAVEDGRHPEIGTHGFAQNGQTLDKHLEESGIFTTQRSSFQSVIKGLGEADFTETEKEKLNRDLIETRDGGADVAASRPYLLLDVRDVDDYKIGRIITAVNFPPMLLSRMNRFEIPEMVSYRNRPGKQIIIYDENEKEAPRVVTTLIQRGYDNVLLLSGGLQAALKKFPTALMTGRLPATRHPESVQRKGRPETRNRTPPRRRSGSLPASASTSSSKSTKSVGAPKELKTNFSDEDLELLRQQLQYNLLPRAAKSRLVQDTSTARIRNKAIREERLRPSKKLWHN